MLSVGKLLSYFKVYTSSINSSNQKTKIFFGSLEIFKETSEIFNGSERVFHWEFGAHFYDRQSDITDGTQARLIRLMFNRNNTILI